MNATIPMSAAKPASPTCTARGIQLPCPCCGETTANISLHLAAIGDGEEFTCQECDTTFSVSDMEEMIAKWTPVLAWINAIPQFGGEGK